MTAPVLVFGHRNPDNDSVCSAVAYAHLKDAIDDGNWYVPVRLGPMPPETQWAFERFGVPAPEVLTHVRMRVRDAMKAEVVTVGPDELLLRAGRLLKERGVRSLPVVEDGRVLGMVTMQMLAERYVEEMSLSGFEALPLTAARLVEALDGELLAGDGERVLSGAALIAASEPDTMVAAISPGDILIVGDRRRTQPQALEAGVGCLIITRGFSPEDGVLDLAAKTGACVVSTLHDAYAVARLLNLSHPVRELMDPEPLLVEPDALLAEAAEDMVASPHREALVVDRDRTLLGILTRTDLARAGRRRVVLVDHNETSQSAEGIEDATVLEIVDHHRIGDVQTAAPALFLNLPVGSTATIVAERYRELGVPMPDEIAGVLLSAVLTDTVLLKSPTTTPLDREIAERLGKRLHLDPLTLGMEIFRARAAGTPFSAQRAVEADLKEYRVGDFVVGVGQIETVDSAEVLAHKGELLAHMDVLLERCGYDLLLLMVTDVTREGSELVAAGRIRLAERAFGVPFGGGSAWFDGLLSRKKQVASRLVESLGA